MTLTLIAAMLLSIPAPAASDKDSKKPRKKGHLPVAVGVKASTLGLGVEAAVPVSRFANVRGGFNGFEYSRSFSGNGILYDGTIRLRSVETQLDIFPFGGRFHISPGMLVYNGNQVTANAVVPGGNGFSLGGASFISNPANPVNGTGKLSLNKVSPMVRWGFGNMVPRNGHLSFHIEGGAIFQGSPKVALNLAGSACDPLVALVCHNVATDPTLQNQVQSEQQKLNKDLTLIKYYPAFSMGLSYKF
jgi:hypothetical protein